MMLLIRFFKTTDALTPFHVHFAANHCTDNILQLAAGTHKGCVSVNDLLFPFQCWGINLPVNCCVDLVAVLFGGEGMKDEAPIGQCGHKVLVWQHGGPFHLDTNSRIRDKGAD